MSDKAQLIVEDHGPTLVVRIDGGEHSLFGVDVAKELDKLIDMVDKDHDRHAVVFTGARPDRFVSHADVRWLQEGGAEVLDEDKVQEPALLSCQLLSISK